MRSGSPRSLPCLLEYSPMRSAPWPTSRHASTSVAQIKQTALGAPWALSALQ